MFRSRRAQTFGLVVLSGALATAASAEVLITYESDIDLDPSTPDIIDLGIDDTTTITIVVSALDGEVDIAGGGFAFEGESGGGGGVTNEIITLSDFMFAEPMQDPGLWLTNNNLPNPAAILFFPGFALPLPVALATLTVHLTGSGCVVQHTNPQIFSGDGFPLALAEGSDSFTVCEVPEPATAALLIVAMTLFARRRVRRVKPAYTEGSGTATLIRRLPVRA